MALYRSLGGRGWLLIFYPDWLKAFSVDRSPGVDELSFSSCRLSAKLI